MLWVYGREIKLNMGRFAWDNNNDDNDYGSDDAHW